MSLGDWKKHFGPGEVTASLGRVRKHPGELEYWQVNDDGDLEVQVVLDNHEVPVVALLGALVGGNGWGVWGIPDEETEVCVVHADGFEGDAVIVGVLPTGNTPGGIGPRKVYLRGVEIVAYGTDPLLAKELGLKEDLADIETKVRAWSPIANDGGAALKVKLLELFDRPSGWPTGTSVLKAE